MNAIHEFTNPRMALKAAREWRRLEREISDFRIKADALRKRQNPLTAALTLYTTENTNPRNPLIELGSFSDGFRLYFTQEPVAIKWKEIAVSRLTISELDALTDTRDTKPVLHIEPRNPTT